MSELQQKKFLHSKGLIFSAIFAALSICVDIAALIIVASGIRGTVTAYIIYGIAALFTIIFGILFIKYRKTIKVIFKYSFLSANLIIKLRKYSLFERVITDYGWRTMLGALVVLAGNIVYVSYLIWMAVAYKSPWYAALAGFYAWLVLTRGGIIFAEKIFDSKNNGQIQSSKYKYIISLFSGIALIIAGGAFSAPVMQMANGTYPKNGDIANIVINTVFAFVKCLSAILQFIRSRAYKDPTISELRNISLVTAMMSLLTLQVSIITVFAKQGDTMWQYVVILGSIVSFITITIGTLSVVGSFLKLKTLNKENEIKKNDKTSDTNFINEDNNYDKTKSANNSDKNIL